MSFSTHSKLQTLLSEDKSRREEFYSEGYIRGTKDRIIDGFKAPWRHVEHRKHTASKAALSVVACVDNIIDVATLPINIPLVALNIFLFKVNKKLEGDLEPHHSFKY